MNRAYKAKHAEQFWKDSYFSVEAKWHRAEQQVATLTEALEKAETSTPTQRTESSNKAAPLVQPVPEVDSARRLVAVAGRLNRTIADFERSCIVHIDEEQRCANPDNALIATLCDAVRLAREYVAAVRGEPVSLEQRLAECERVGSLQTIRAWLETREAAVREER